MAKFVERTVCPDRTDKRYINYQRGGCSTAIAIDNSGYTLPNCVGYAQGRFMELRGENSVNWSLPAGNAETWFSTAKSKGFQTGSEPKLGAVCCWKKGNEKTASDGAGHVAIVEKIMPNGDILISQSHAGGNAFDTQTITKASNYAYGDCQFQGFIYCGIDYEVPVVKPVSQLYRVRKVWEDASTQKGAYSVYDNAVECANKNPGHKVFDVNGKCLYTSTEPMNKEVYITAAALNVRKGPGIDNPVIGCLRDGTKKYIIKEKSGNWGRVENPSGWICLDYTKDCELGTSFKVRVTTDALNIRKGPSIGFPVVGCINDRGVYTIVERSGDFGKLKSGAGWISMSYVQPV